MPIIVYHHIRLRCKKIFNLRQDASQSSLDLRSSFWFVNLLLSSTFSYVLFRYAFFLRRARLLSSFFVLTIRRISISTMSGRGQNNANDNPIPPEIAVPPAAIVASVTNLSVPGKIAYFRWIAMLILKASLAVSETSTKTYPILCRDSTRNFSYLARTSDIVLVCREKLRCDEPTQNDMNLMRQLARDLFSHDTTKVSKINDLFTLNLF